ncbi:V-type ATP synthase subunit E [Candidatus Micrarchaeota archaeon]|nr:V-type ATP synthase subunit E [Candidatus Micrarchaeota archaeon]MBU1166608.1 V-type ATP synthase subunit E [Candidatus Micrarchaeota archaeon]MBU1887260.1 V-type ATP synthase subunit E [Candidatus Micrarchaeota archaeon]
MGIEKLKNSLLSEANEEANKIIQSAEAHVKSMIEEERVKHKLLETGANDQIAKVLQESRNERIAWARLEAKRVLAEAKEDSIKAVLEVFFNKLNDVRKTSDYKKFIQSSAKQAVQELGKGSKVHVLKGEKKLVGSIAGARVSEDLNALGGLLVENVGGKIRIDLTLETLFDNRRDDLRKVIAEKLFGGK